MKATDEMFSHLDRTGGFHEFSIGRSRQAGL